VVRSASHALSLSGRSLPDHSFLLKTHTESVAEFQNSQKLSAYVLLAMLVLLLMITFCVSVRPVHVNNTHPKSCCQKAHPWVFCAPASFEIQQILALLVAFINQQQMLAKKMTSVRTVDCFVCDIPEIILVVSCAVVFPRVERKHETPV
jgi:hypothetical protein